MRSSTEDDFAFFFNQLKQRSSVRVNGSTGKLTSLSLEGWLYESTPEAFTVRTPGFSATFDLRGSRFDRDEPRDFWEVRLPDGDMLTVEKLSD